MWKKIKLESLMHIETGSRNTEDRIDGARYPFFVRSQEVERINEYAYDCEAVLTAGDGVGTGKVFHYINGKFDAHQRVYVMTQFNGIDGKFFYYYFSRYFLDEVAKYTAKSSVDSVRRAMIADMEIPLPPIPEQRRIAAALSDADECITALEKLIAKKRNIKQGAMQELLTGKRRLPGFSGEWEEKRLRETYTNITTGKLDANAMIDGGQYRFYTCAKMYVFIDDYAFDDEALLISGNGENVGYVHYYKGKFNAYQRTYVLTGFTSNIFFVKAYLEHYLQDRIKDTVRLGNTPYITKDVIEEMTINLPIYSEQTAIAAILSDMDAEIAVLMAKLNKFRNIKQGMMSELLTGRIRLVEQKVKATPAVKIEELPEQKQKTLTTQTSGHNQQFDDAVMIAGIVDTLYSDKYPLGRKKVQKSLYLLRRHQDASTEVFKKKAAGPYADEVRYKGGEPIARNAKYITTTTTKGKGTIFAKGDKISQALDYINSWGKQDDIKWVAKNLKYRSGEDLELLATVDMAICDLEEAGTDVSVASIKHLIATNAEWQAKLKKQTFSDDNIARAIRELQIML